MVLDKAGRMLGALPSFSLAPPWWQVVAPVVAAARERFGLELCVLRLLHAERPRAHGGAVTYLAELTGDAASGSAALFAPPDTRTLELATRPEPLRMAWAEPGGPRRSLEWAGAELAARGLGSFQAAQERSWNLSAIWQLTRVNGSGPPFWLKQVPNFFAHEGAVLSWLNEAAPNLGPKLIADDGHGRLLLEHVPGEDCHGAPVALRAELAVIAHRIAECAAPLLPSLIASGVPDRRGMTLARHIRGALAAAPMELDLRGVAPLLSTLEERCSALSECGVPDTLVHGDLHPGNAREQARQLVVIDWGDSFIGHPGFDILRLAEGCTEAEADSLVDAWSSRWRKARPGSDPERAILLLRPLAALRAAATYAHFLAEIEPSEHPYHVFDVPEQLALAERLATRRETPHTRGQ